MVVGEANTGGALWFFQNRDVSGSEFDTQPGLSGFHHSRTLGPRLGNGLAVGDFNNDAKLDFAASDTNDGSGKVFVWY